MKVSIKQNDLLVHAPAIWFHTKSTKKSEKSSTNASKDDKDNFNKFYVPIDKNDIHNEGTTEWLVRKFEEGTAEDYIKWRMRFDELTDAMNWETVEKKYPVIQTLLRGEARARFNAGYQNEGEGESPITAAAKKELAERKLKAGYTAMAKPLFLPVESAWRRQRTYLRYHLRFGQMTVNEFRNRLVEMNKYLKYFPVPPKKESVSSLDEEELVEILDRAKPVEYHMDVLAADYDPYSKSFQEYVEYIERLETKHAIRKKLEAEAKAGSRTDNGEGDENKKKKKNRKRKHNSSGTDSPEKCGNCGELGHRTAACWDDPKNASKRPKGYKPKHKRMRGSKDDSQVNFSMEQMSFLMNNFKSLSKNGKSKKRQMKFESEDSDSESESAHFLTANSKSNKDADEYYSQPEHSYSIAGAPERHRTKRQKEKHMTTAVIVEMKAEDGTSVPLRCLLDTGTTSTIVLAKFVHKNTGTYKTKATTWKTLGGNFKTRRKARINFKMPEFSEMKSITWSAHLDEFTDPEKAQYDMIVGTDLMEACGIDILFSQNKIIWDGDELPMSNRGLVSDREATEMLFQAAKQAPIIQKAESRHKKILDADYSRVDIDKYVRNSSTSRTTSKAD